MPTFDCKSHALGIKKLQKNEFLIQVWQNFKLGTKQKKCQDYLDFRIPVLNSRFYTSLGQV